MKKSLILSLITLAALVSCKQEAPQTEFIPAELTSGIFHATIETAGATKVFTDESLHVLWNADDYISIFDKTTRNKQYRFTGADGANGGDFEEVGDTFGTGSDIEYNYAVYPYDAANAYVFDNILSTSFPAVQTYRANSFGPGANLMVARSATHDLSFKNVGSYVRFRLFGSGITVRSIALSGNGGEVLAGPVRVTPGEGGIPSMAFDDTDPSALGYSIILDASAAPVALGADDSGSIDFWMVVPPVSLEGGFTLTVVDANGQVYEKSTSKAVSFTRSQLLTMKAFDVRDGALDFGIYPASGEAYHYTRGHDMMNIYEADGLAWFRFLVESDGTVLGLGPIPESVAQGDTFVASLTSYSDGTPSQEILPYRLTVLSYAGGILNLVSSQGDRFIIRF